MDIYKWDFRSCTFEIVYIFSMHLKQKQKLSVASRHPDQVVEAKKFKAHNEFKKTQNCNQVIYSCVIKE